MKWIFFVLCIGLLVYETVAILNSQNGDTISEIFWSLSINPMVPFMAGFLCGHLFWPKRDKL